ncbi:MAG: hypothetical protein NZ108_02235, partial [Bacteroidia bacterium]|nr:hypothetical protein [Bacteroidia bacterium]
MIVRLFVVFGLFFSVAFGQTPLILPQTGAEEQICWDAISDKFGYWYFATNQGVLQYNGLSFYLIPTKTPVRKLALGNNQILWVGCKEDFGKINLQTKTNPRYESFKTDDSFLFNQVIDIRVSGDVAHFLTERLVLQTYADKPGFSSFSLPEEVIGSGFLGNTWLMMGQKSGLVELSLSGVKDFPQKGQFQVPGLYRTCPLSNGKTVVAGLDDKLYLWDGSNLQPFASSVHNLTVDGRIFGVSSNESGQIAIATFSRGLLILDENGKLLFHLTKELPTLEIYSVKGSGAGFWVGFANGLHYIGSGLPISVSPLPSLYAQINDILDWNGNRYVATNIGLFENGQKINGIESSEIWQLATDGKQLYIATSAGLYILKAGKPVKLFSQPVFSIRYVDNQFFFAGENAAGTVSGESIKNEIEKIRIEANSYWNDGNVGYIGSNYQGLIRVSGGKGEFLNKVNPTLDGAVSVFSVKKSPYFLTRTGVFVAIDNQIKQVKGLEHLNVSLVKSIQVQNDLIYVLQEHKILAFRQESGDRFVPEYGHSGNIAGKVDAFTIHETRINLISGDKWINTPTFLDLNRPTVSSLLRVFSSDSLLFYHTPDTTATLAEVNLAYTHNNAEYWVGLVNSFFPGEHEVYYSFDKLTWKKSSSNGIVKHGELSDGKHTLFVRIILAQGGMLENEVAVVEVAPPWWRSWIAYLSYLMVLGVGVWGAIRWNRIRTEKKHQRLLQDAEQWIEELDNQVNIKTAELAKTTQELQEANDDMKASILYASRIQRSLLPSKHVIENYFSAVEVWYQPKDVVSGDFYWFYETDRSVYLAVADCTGHGVPGALMSV